MHLFSISLNFFDSIEHLYQSINIFRVSLKIIRYIRKIKYSISIRDKKIIYIKERREKVVLRNRISEGTARRSESHPSL